MDKSQLEPLYDNSSVFVIVNALGTAVVSEFAMPQNPPQPPNYVETTELDPRVIAWRLLGHPRPAN